MKISSNLVSLIHAERTSVFIDLYPHFVFTTTHLQFESFSGISSRSSRESFQGPSMSAAATEGSLISVQFYPIPSASIPNGPGSESPKYVIHFLYQFLLCVGM